MKNTTLRPSNASLPVQILFLCTLFLPWWNTLAAQDTVSVLPEYYMTPDGWCDNYSGQQYAMSPGGSGYCVVGFPLAKDATIYGMAIAYFYWLGTGGLYTYWNTDPYNYVTDSILDLTYEHSCLFDFDRSTGSLSVIDQKTVNIRDTPVAHWLNTGGTWDSGTGSTHIPLYETYFDQPYSYSSGDTVFVGATTLSFDRQPYLYYHMQKIMLMPSTCPSSAVALTSSASQWSVTTLPGHHFIFPLLSPDPNPSAGIENPSANPASLTVGPNPANASATVRCGVPLAEVLLCDATGRTLLRTPCPADGSAPSLDTRSLPSGLYIVRALPRDGSATLVARLCVAH